MGNFLFPDFYLYPPRPIWYPDKNYDFSQIKLRDGYPDFVQEPSRATWGKLERIGEIVSCNIGKRIKTEWEFVQMSKANLLTHMSNSKSITRKLSFISLFIKYPFIKRIYVRALKMKGDTFVEY